MVAIAYYQFGLFFRVKSIFTMPSYCTNIPVIDSIPEPDDMILYQPYFEVPAGCTSFKVHIMVPSNCYVISSDSSAAPASGACGSPSDLQHTIYILKNVPCSNTDRTQLIHTLAYEEDPNGHTLYVYVVDAANGTVKGAVKSKRKFIT